MSQGVVCCGVMSDVCVDALESASDKLHKEKLQWQQEQEKLQQEVAELRTRLAQGERSVVWWPPLLFPRMSMVNLSDAGL